MTIGFVSAVISRDASWNAMGVGIGRAAREGGYEVLEVTPGEGAAILDRGIQYLRQNRVDGLVVYKSDTQRFPACMEKAKGLPIVHIWYYPKRPYPMVALDAEPGLIEAADHLAAFGHKTVLWLGLESGGKEMVMERRRAFRRACTTHRMTVRTALLPRVKTARGEAPSAVGAFHRLLMDRLPELRGATAVVCYNDTMAMAVEFVLAARGIRVPEHVSIIGFDDVQAPEAVPALTTVSHSLEAIGARGVEVLLEIIEDSEAAKQYRRRAERVPSRLVIRESTGRPSGKED
jgi:DNA-binding LacI/PurR family transcriptional regulator